MHNEPQLSRYAEWQAIIDEQEKSGLSQADFCQSKNIVLSKFVYYRGCVKKIAHSSDKTLLPVKVVSKESASASDIRIVLPNGFQLSFSSSLEPLRVKQLVEVLLSC